MKILGRTFIVLALLIGVAQPIQVAAEPDGYQNLPGWHWVAGGVLRGVSFPTASLGIAVGDGGLIIRSSDGGVSWQQVSSGVKTDLKHVQFINESRGWAVGEQGIILYSEDGGQSWNKQTSPSSADLNRLFFFDANNGWIVGNNGTILYTNNGGTNWTQQTSGTTNHLYGLDFVDTSYGWAVGASGLVIATTNGGSSWQNQPSCGSHELYDVDFTDRNNGWLVGWGGHLCKAARGGEIWGEWILGWTSDLYDIELTPGGGGLIIGAGGFIAQHTLPPYDWWETINSGTDNNLYGVDFIDANHGWIVGKAGMVLATANGGSSWEQHIGSTTGNINDLYFVDDQRGWAAVGWSSSGFPGQILHTQDGGATWSFQKTGIDFVNDIEFVNANIGWAAAGIYGNGYIFSTLDGGAHWTSQLELSYRPMRGLHFMNAAYGWVVGGAGNGNGWIYATTNGGQTWAEQKYLEGQQNLLDVCFSDFNNGWAVGEYGTIYATNDGGEHWNSQTSGVDKTLKSLYCYGQRVWVAGEDIILFTSNGGTTWQTQRNRTGIEYYNDIDFSGPGWGWVVGGSNTTYETLALATGDLGNSWIAEDIPLNFGGAVSVHATHYGLGPVIWMGGGNGIILSNLPDANVPVSTTVTPAEGGDLFSKDGNVHLEFPAGLVTANTVITYTPTTLSQAPSTGRLSAWTIFDLSAEPIIRSLDDIIESGTCYTMTVDYKGWLVSEDAALGIYHWDGSDWVLEPTSQADRDLDRATACPNHFSYFALLGNNFYQYLPIILR